MNLFSDIKVSHELRNINNIENLTDTFKHTYIQVRDKWKYTARISEIMQMIKYLYGIEEFDLLDFHTINNGEFESKLVDHLISYKSGHDIDFGNIWESIIKKTIPLTVREQNLIETGKIDERLWAIFTVVINPSLEI